MTSSAAAAAKAENGAKEMDEKAAPAPDTAEVAKQALAALAMPSKLWEPLTADERRQIASAALNSLFDERKRFARGVEWAYAPEIALLDRCGDDDRPGLAKSLLEVRAGIAQHQLDFEGERLEVVKALRAQISKWTSIADLGLALLVFGFVAMLAALGGLCYLVAADELSGWALPAAIFALALFAISPAVLLLRERPLEGLDKWMPGGKAEEDEEESTTTSSTAKAATS
jgi:hypothetical protein